MTKLMLLSLQSSLDASIQAILVIVAFLLHLSALKAGTWPFNRIVASLNDRVLGHSILHFEANICLLVCAMGSQ